MEGPKTRQGWTPLPEKVAAAQTSTARDRPTTKGPTLPAQPTALASQIRSSAARLVPWQACPQDPLVNRKQALVCNQSEAAVASGLHSFQMHSTARSAAFLRCPPCLCGQVLVSNALTKVGLSNGHGIGCVHQDEADYQLDTKELGCKAPLMSGPYRQLAIQTNLERRCRHCQTAAFRNAVTGAAEMLHSCSKVTLPHFMAETQTSSYCKQSRVRYGEASDAMVRRQP